VSRPHRFHVPLPLAPGAELPLPPAVAHQVARVLRARVGQRLVLFAGDGAEYPAELVSLTPPTARLGAATFPDTELPAALHVAVAALKGEKPEWVVQKLTELGAARVTFLETERAVATPGAERWSRRLERYARVAAEAAEQSGRVRVPAVAGPDSLAGVLAAGERPAFILDPAAPARLAERLCPCPAAALLLVGPEGGFTATETAAAHEAGAVAVGLGRRVLRAETAALAAAALFAAAVEGRDG